MPEPTFGPDKCQEDKCLNPQVQAFVHRGICPLLAFVLRGICPTGGQMPVQAFVLPGICLSRHLSANRFFSSLFEGMAIGLEQKESGVWQLFMAVAIHGLVICYL